MLQLDLKTFFKTPFPGWPFLSADFFFEAVAVKVNGGRRIRVCRFIGNMDLRIDAERQNFVG